MSSYQTPRGIKSDYVTFGNYEGQQRSLKNLQTAGRCVCDMPPCLINIEHIGDIDIEPSFESLNLLKR